MAIRVTRDMLTTLLDQLQVLFPISLKIHGTLQNIANSETGDSEIWVDAWPEVKAVLMYPSSGEQVVPTIEIEHRLFASTVESAKYLLEKLNPFAGYDRIILRGVRELLRPVVEDFAKAVSYRSQTVAVSCIFYLPDSTPLRETPLVPDGYRLGGVLPSHAPLISRKWKVYSEKEAEVYMESLIQTFPSVGVFEKVSGNLVAWMICYEDKAMGHLYVSPSHRQKSLGTLCLVSLTRILREQGQVPYVFVEPGNSVSREFHQKVGFVGVGENFHWLIYTKIK